MRNGADTWCSPEGLLMKIPLESSTSSLPTEVFFVSNWGEVTAIDIWRSLLFLDPFLALLSEKLQEWK
jgi:hypothetical protein